MKNSNVMHFFLRFRTVFLSLAFLVLLVSCMNDEDDFVSEPVEVAYVSIYHASPDAPDFDIIVDDRVINRNPFDYASYSGYLNFFTGNRNIQFRAFNDNNVLIDTTFNLQKGEAYSLFTVNRVDDIQALLVVDSAAAPAQGKAMVRFVHLSPDAPAFDIASGGQLLFDNQSFKQATPYTEVDAGVRAFQVQSADGGDVVLSAEDVDIQAAGYYTVIVRGFATPPAGNTNVLSVEVLD